MFAIIWKFLNRNNSPINSRQTSIKNPFEKQKKTLPYFNLCYIFEDKIYVMSQLFLLKSKLRVIWKGKIKIRGKFYYCLFSRYFRRGFSLYLWITLIYATKCNGTLSFEKLLINQHKVSIQKPSYRTLCIFIKSIYSRKILTDPYQKYCQHSK